MLNLNRHVQALCSAPVGCAFLLIIEEAKIASEVAAQPAVALHAAAIAQRWLSPFDPDHEWTASTVLAEGPRLRGLARRLLASPSADWIFGPLDRTAQLWISETGKPPDPQSPITPSDQPTSWERYAQKPARRMFTSTAVDGISSRIAAFAHYAGDWNQQPPISQYLLRATQEARIFEVDDAASWHRLCVSYPAVYDDGGFVPDWSALARDWDAVHLSLGGLLTAEQVRVESSEGWSRLWGWDAEQTLWLRWCFGSVERVTDITSFPNPSVPLDWPRWIFELHIERVKRGEIPGTS